MEALRNLVESLSAGMEDLEMSTPGLTVAAVTAGVAGAAALAGTSSVISGKRRRAAADRKRDLKRETCRKSIEELQKRLGKDPMAEEDIQRITDLSLTDLVAQLKEGHLSPSQVLKAYQTKALETHAVTNCLIEVVTEAESWAQELEGKPREGLLYGVPISIKEDIALKGYDSTMGCVGLIGKPAVDDAAIVKVLKRQGAIPFVRSNIPQLCMSFEPGNPIFGDVLNPHDLRHGPGGSSSGEAALSAAGASLLGFGSDLAGSVRVPAHFTGVCGFKPTAQRMSNVGCLADYACYEQNEIGAVFGPLAPEVENIVLGLRALWDGVSPSLTDLDPISLPLTFNNQVYESSRKLRIGFYTEDGVFPLFPGCARAVMETKACLEKMGHEVFPWRIPDMAQAREFIFSVVQSDGGDLQRQLLKHDIMHPNIEPVVGESPSFVWLRQLIAKAISPMMPQLAATIEAAEGEPDLPSFFLLVSKLRNYVVEVMQEWNAAGLDAVICPPFAMPSPRFGNADLCMMSGAYTMAYNSLNMPAGVVPVTKVTSDDIDKLADYPQDEPFHVRAKQAMSETLGMPMGVMVVGARYQDEVCLRLMKEIQTALRNHDDKPSH